MGEREKDREILVDLRERERARGRNEEEEEEETVEKGEEETLASRSFAVAMQPVNSNGYLTPSNPLRPKPRQTPRLLPHVLLSQRARSTTPGLNAGSPCSDTPCTQYCASTGRCCTGILQRTPAAVMAVFQKKIQRSRWLHSLRP